ncbi:MAG: class I SAM-dependent rRNA methyltransferase [bacterium]|nr:class I SAM-dependent rRNA methyltransferase [bacterium]
MLEPAKIFVDEDCARAIKYGSPTIYNPAIKQVKGEPRPGDVVEIYSLDGEFLGKGIWQAGKGIRVRIFTRDPREEITKELVLERVTRANKKRKQWGFKDVYRMVYGDSDYLPSLIIDRFGDIAVLQDTDPFLDSIRKDIAEHVLSLEPGIETVYEKNDSRARQKSTLPPREGLLAGKEKYETVIEEHGLLYKVSVLGQKTGFYLDQRDNRLKLRKYIEPGDKVLDVFSYTGGFGLNAAAAGADEVWLVDISEKALEVAKENAKMNSLQDKIKTIAADALEYLKKLYQHGERFDVVVLDPPAFVTSKKGLKKGLQAYFAVNRFAYRLAKRVVVTCSCSQHLTLLKFIETVRAAAADAKKVIRIVEIGTQPQDHPILPGAPTTWYLKVLFTEPL